MNTLDIILLIFIGLSSFNGLKRGLIRSLGDIIALLVGAYLASTFYLQLQEWLIMRVELNESIAGILAFVILFIVLTRAISLLFYFLEKTFNTLAIIPGSKYINNILGAVFGFLKASIFFALVIHVSSHYLFFDGALYNLIKASLIKPYLDLILKIILPLLPQAIRALQSIL